jgi:hypothetical protein
VSQPSWLDLRLSIGHIVQAVILCVGIGATYEGLSARQDAVSHEIELQRTALTMVEANFQRVDVATAREAALVEALKDLKQRLERIENKLDATRR